MKTQQTACWYLCMKTFQLALILTRNSVCVCLARTYTHQGDTGTGGDPIFGSYVLPAGPTCTSTNCEILFRSASGAYTALPYELHFSAYATRDTTCSVRVCARVLRASKFPCPLMTVSTVPGKWGTRQIHRIRNPPATHRMHHQVRRLWAVPSDN